MLEPRVPFVSHKFRTGSNLWNFSKNLLSFVSFFPFSLFASPSRLCFGRAYPLFVRRRTDVAAYLFICFLFLSTGCFRCAPHPDALYKRSFSLEETLPFSFSPRLFPFLSFFSNDVTCVVAYLEATTLALASLVFPRRREKRRKKEK